tara:strand:+ start:6761 stop:7108 length:348 start_codon:yes stop_codon:yes gene_type:complete
MAGYSSNRRVWYSDTKPKGEGALDPSNYNYDMAKKMDEVYYNNPSILSLLMGGKGENPRDKKEVYQIQQFLGDIGYLDNQSELDSLWGPKTAGASHRYILNKPSPISRLLDWIDG